MIEYYCAECGKPVVLFVETLIYLQGSANRAVVTTCCGNPVWLGNHGLVGLTLRDTWPKRRITTVGTAA